METRFLYEISWYLNAGRQNFKNDCQWPSSMSNLFPFECDCDLIDEIFYSFDYSVMWQKADYLGGPNLIHGVRGRENRERIPWALDGFAAEEGQTQGLSNLKELNSPTQTDGKKMVTSVPQARGTEFC